MGWVIVTLSLLPRLGLRFFSILANCIQTIGKILRSRIRTNREPPLFRTSQNLTEEEEDKDRELAIVVLKRLQDIKPGETWEGHHSALVKLLSLHLRGFSNDAEVEALEEAEDDEGGDSLRLEFDILEYLFK